MPWLPLLGSQSQRTRTLREILVRSRSGGREELERAGVERAGVGNDGGRRDLVISVSLRRYINLGLFGKEAMISKTNKVCVLLEFRKLVESTEELLTFALVALLISYRFGGRYLAEPGRVAVSGAVKQNGLFGSFV